MIWSEVAEGGNGGQARPWAYMEIEIGSSCIYYLYHLFITNHYVLQYAKGNKIIRIRSF